MVATRSQVAPAADQSPRSAAARASSTTGDSGGGAGLGGVAQAASSRVKASVVARAIQDRQIGGRALAPSTGFRHLACFMMWNDNLVAMQPKREGQLQVVATPIGNLQDISPRAVEVLASADLVVAEDTRHSRGLLAHHGLSPSLQAMHEHNEAAAIPAILARLKAGEQVAVISDAGTPLISDPGYRLVRAAHEAGITVRAVPGPSAVTAALSVCGLPTDRFTFEGFLPAREAARRSTLESLLHEPRTLVFFETGQRIQASLETLVSVFGGDREIAVCRELTKRFETVLPGPAREVLERVTSDSDQRRGEFVLVVAGADRPEPDRQAAIDLARELARELPASKAARVAARITGVPRRELFAALDSDDDY